MSLERRLERQRAVGVFAVPLMETSSWFSVVDARAVREEP